MNDDSAGNCLQCHNTYLVRVPDEALEPLTVHRGVFCPGKSHVLGQVAIDLEDPPQQSGHVCAAGAVSEELAPAYLELV